MAFDFSAGFFFGNLGVAAIIHGAMVCLAASPGDPRNCPEVEDPVYCGATAQASCHNLNLLDGVRAGGFPWGDANSLRSVASWIDERGPLSRSEPCSMAGRQTWIGIKRDHLLADHSSDHRLRCAQNYRILTTREETMSGTLPWPKQNSRRAIG